MSRTGARLVLLASALLACGCAVALLKRGGGSEPPADAPAPAGASAPGAPAVLVPPSPPPAPGLTPVPPLLPGPLPDPAPAPLPREPEAVSPEPAPAPAPATPSLPIAPPPPDAPDRLVTWSEGGVPRRAWADPGVLIEFTPRAGADGGAEPPAPGARLLADGRVRVWQLPEGLDARALAASKVAAGQGAYSAGLRDGPGTTEPLRAAAPGLLVRFKPETGEAERAAVADRHGLKGGTPLPRGPGWYAYEGPMGLAAIELAGVLTGQGPVIEASPNWWRPVRPR